MFRIGEFSKLTQVSVRMLRYYDETGLLRPAQIDKFTGYRLYSTDEIPTLNKILFLRDTGFSVAEIAAALDEWSDDIIGARLRSKRQDVEAAIQSEKNKLSKIDLALRDLAEEKIETHYSFSIKHIPRYNVISLRRIIPDYFAEGMLWKELAAFVETNYVPVSENSFAIYHDQDYREKDVDVEVCCSVPKLGHSVGNIVYRSTEAVDRMASTMISGPFENIAGRTDRLRTGSGSTTNTA